MSRQRFIEVMQPPLLRLSQDLKAILRIVEDPEIDDESRVALAGGLLHAISSSTAIPGVRGVLRNLGEILLLRLLLEQTRNRAEEAFAKHVEASPELLGTLDEELAAARDYLGENIKVLEDVASKAPNVNHEGHGASECVLDEEASNWLYDSVHEALIERFDFDEEDVARELKQVDQILPPLAAKLRR